MSLAEARAALEAAQARATGAEAELVHLKLEHLRLRDSFDSRGPTSVEAVYAASEYAARGERVLASARADVEHYEAAVHEEELAIARARYDELVVDLADATASILEPVRELVAVHREAARIVCEEIAPRVIAAQDAHAEALGLARALGLEHQFRTNVRRLEVDEARMLGTTAIGEAERREGRASIDAWIVAAPEPKWTDPSADARRKAVVFLKEAS